MKVLVTGAAGFIASHLIPYLVDRRYSVVGTDFRHLQLPIYDKLTAFFEWDIRKAGEIDSFVPEVEGCEVMFHLAAIAAPRIAAADPSTAWETNVRGTQNVLELARRAKVQRVIFLSSSHVYGIPPKYMPTDEAHPLHMHDEYTTTKILGEALCALHYDNHGLPYCAVRLFNSYGVGQSTDYFLGAKIKQALTEHRVAVAGEYVTKDWVAIEDVVVALDLLARSNYVGPLNIGTGKQTSLEVIGRQIAFVLGVPYEGLPTDDKGPNCMQADASRAERLLGWRPTLPLSTRLERLILHAQAKSRGG